MNLDEKTLRARLDRHDNAAQAQRLAAAYTAAKGNLETATAHQVLARHHENRAAGIRFCLRAIGAELP